tara:strand:- start:546 stop:926 length:381 start_codon:yes stop_codon:yes gene_type:complete
METNNQIEIGALGTPNASYDQADNFTFTEAVVSETTNGRTGEKTKNVFFYDANGKAMRLNKNGFSYAKLDSGKRVGELGRIDQILTIPAKGGVLVSIPSETQPEGADYIVHDVSIKGWADTDLKVV